MPNKHVTITGEYTTSYKVQIVNGTINGQSVSYLSSGNTYNLQANTIQGKVFQKWEGDTQYISAVYDANTVLNMPSDSINLVAKFEDENEQNGIGYILTSCYNNDTINIEEIIVISGTIQIGFMFTDIKGHIYVITSLNNNVASIIRITKKIGGTENGQ